MARCSGSARLSRSGLYSYSDKFRSFLLFRIHSGSVPYYSYMFKRAIPTPPLHREFYKIYEKMLKDHQGNFEKKFSLPSNLTKNIKKSSIHLSYKESVPPPIVHVCYYLFFCFGPWTCCSPGSDFLQELMTQVQGIPST
jgi:hypothetical protein